MTIEIYVGKDSQSYLEELCKFRIEIFREYPYLYVGNLEHEKNYANRYVSDKQAMIALAKINGEIAGISTGIPLSSESGIVADVKKIFEEQKTDIKDYYYYGEVMVLPKFRGKKIAEKLYVAQNELIAQWGFKYACILTIVPETNHPLKPQDYKSTDSLWQRLGFCRNNLTVRYHWPTIRADKAIEDTYHTLEFWTKSVVPRWGFRGIQ